ncbi:hypothetical protein Ddye_015547 [Dipteronia dyeriana]|uniref:Uncharacterized protein n=1 Tax=Dipteronia dyeriana TaxID=168575 RepID=A0AAD9U5S7_9ROSI|nr:hypothetical protein Ddye_015547 [Dipteronia dyeriana]
MASHAFRLLRTPEEDRPLMTMSNLDLDPPTNEDNDHKMKQIQIDNTPWVGFELGSADDWFKVLDLVWKRRGSSFLASAFAGGFRSDVTEGGRSSSNDGEFRLSSDIDVRRWPQLLYLLVS